MSTGNWSEWLGTQNPNTQPTPPPNYVALADDNPQQNTNHPHYPYPPPSNQSYNDSFPPHDLTAPMAPPSSSHYNGQQQFNASYYPHQYHTNTASSHLAPPSDYLSHVHKHKKSKKHKKKCRPPARPQKPTKSPVSNEMNVNMPTASKEYEMIIDNVPLQIRSRELQQALSAQKCHLWEFYTPDVSKPSTIIIVVKGFIQWRQLSKLNEIEIRGTKCPIKPKPLKTLEQEKKKENEQNNDVGEKKGKDDDVEMDKREEHLIDHANEDLISQLNELQNVIGITQPNENGKDDQITAEESNRIIEIKESVKEKDDAIETNVDSLFNEEPIENETNFKIESNETDNDSEEIAIITIPKMEKDNDPMQKIAPTVLKDDLPQQDKRLQKEKENVITEQPAPSSNPTTIKEEGTNENDESAFNVKLEVPEVPDMMMMTDEVDEEELGELDAHFVSDDSDNATYDNEQQIFEQECPLSTSPEGKKEEICKNTKRKQLQSPFQPMRTNQKQKIAKAKLTRAVKNIRQNKIKNQLLTPSPTKRIEKPVKTYKSQRVSLPNKMNKTSPPKLEALPNKVMKTRTKQSPIAKSTKSTRKKHEKLSNRQKQSALQYNKRVKGVKVNKTNIPKIAIPRFSKCTVAYSTRSQFMDKLIKLSCEYHHDTMGMITFRAMMLKIEDIMSTSAKTTTTYKMACGQLLRKYKEFKNVYKLESFANDNYGPNANKVKAQTPIERLLLTRDQLEVNGYPIKSDYMDDEYKDFVETPKKAKKRKRYDLLAIDCEMCKTTKGSELTRISIVDSKLMVVYDKLVKPPNEIIDYLTEWSGITHNLLKDETRTIEDVHEDIFDFMDANTILCGHSLENDLIAMKIIHYKVIDTAVLFMKRHRFRNNKRNIGYSIGSGGGRKLSLKHLCNKYLNKKIQASKGPDGQIVGHSSVEDAIAAMQLLQLQLKWEEERNKKLGISVPNSMTQYVVYADDAKKKDGKKEENNDIVRKENVEKNEKTLMIQAKIKQKKKEIMANCRSGSSNLAKRKRQIIEKNDNNGDDVIAMYKKPKKRKVDSSKQRFNPLSVVNTAQCFEMTSKDVMLSSLFDDDNDNSESDNFMIVSTPKCTEKSIVQTQPKSRGIKRKLSCLEDDDENENILPFSPKKKLKISPSKMKTRKKEKSTESSGDGFKLDIAQDSESESQNSHSEDDDDDDNDSDSIYSVKSISKSTSFPVDEIIATNDADLSSFRPPTPPPIVQQMLDGNIEKKLKEAKRKHRSEKKKLKKERRKKEKKKKRKKEKKMKKAKEYTADAKKIIAEWCHTSLKPLFKEKKISRDDYKAIVKKSVDKILQSHDVWTKENVKRLQTKSKEKVMDVIKAYTKKYRRSCKVKSK